MKKYFLYELKKSGYVILCLALIATGLYVAPLITSDTILRSASETYVWVISTIAVFLAAGVPVLVFNYKMKKRSVDLFYSLPLSHTKILAVKFLIGLIAVFAAYTVAYWLGAVTLIIRYYAASDSHPFYPVYYLPQYFASLLPIFFVYAISSFAFTRANKTIDGIFFIIFWMFAPALIVSVLDNLSLVSVSAFYPLCFCNFAPLDFLTAHFQEHLRGYLNIHALSFIEEHSLAELVNIVIGFTLTALLAVGATTGLFLTEKRQKAEKVEQISNSWFGYKVMIPLYTVCLICLSAHFMFIILLVLVAVGAFLLTMLYRRTVKIGLVQGLIYGGSVLAGVIIVVIYWLIILIML